MAEQDVPEVPPEPDEYDFAPEPPKPAGPAPVSAFDVAPPSAHQPEPDAPSGVNEYIGPAPDKAEGLRAAVAHLLGVAGFLGPLAYRLGREEESLFVNDQSKEALNFQLTMLLAWVAAGFASFTCLRGYLFPIVEVVSVVSCVMAALSAKEGCAYRYPYTLRFIK